MISDYYKNLPKKRMGAGALIFNARGEILFVKASYRDSWSLPGGVVDGDESPKAACLREVKEEVGLSLKDAKFLGVDYIPANSERNEALQFIFFAGVLNENEIAKIKVDGEEIVEYRFMEINQALPMLGERIMMRLPKCLEAFKNNTSVYLENGR